jgi:hypothetical protein
MKCLPRTSECSLRCTVLQAVIELENYGALIEVIYKAGGLAWELVFCVNCVGTMSPQYLAASSHVH